MTQEKKAKMALQETQEREDSQGPKENRVCQVSQECSADREIQESQVNRVLLVPPDNKE